MLWLTGQLRQQYAHDADAIIAGLSARRMTTLRVNTNKATKDAIVQKLTEAGLVQRSVLFYENALILPAGSEAAIRKLPMYDEGEIYLQNVSAMLPAIALGARPGQDILDMCAAPGGKTSLIVELTKGAAMVTACEPDRIRCDRLRHNLQRLGCDRVNVLQTDARKLNDMMKFDAILVDAPCSGSGTVDLTNEKHAFSEKLADNSVKLQTLLLQKACRLLKKGGTLLYSTCSLLRQENEDQVNRLIKNEKMQLVPLDTAVLNGVPALENTVPGTLTVKPTEEYEGFFMAKFTKTGD